MSDSTAVGTANWEEWTDRVSSWQDMTSDIPKMVREDISKARMMPQEAARGMKSLATDPLSVQYAMGYKDRKYSLTYDVLKRIPHQLSMIGAIINTRINQVSSFSVPYRASKSVGFVIKHKDPSHLTSKSEQKFIQDLEKFIYHCGHPEPNPHNSKKRDDFETFLKKIVRDSMTFDQACIELVPDRRGIPYEFVAVDASTIRIASPNSSNMSPFSNSHSRDPAYSGRLLQYMNNSSEERGSPYRSVQLYDQDDKPAYVQVMNGQIENVYTEDEMVFGVRNPRTDIYIQGYGYSELEQLITIITSHLYAEEYNRRFFMQGSAPKGVLNFKGDAMTPDMLEGFRRQWRANLEGVENCLSGDTCIYTAEQGFISLEEICGDRLEVPVHIWTGKSWETGLVYKTKEEKILCHTILDNGVTISSSPDHKFRVIGEDGKPVWCTQKELCDDDVVLVNKQDPSLDTELMCLGRKVTPEFMEVLGWFLGDGNVYYKTNDRGYSAGAMLSWFYNADTELDICDRHLEVIQEYFPQAYRYTHTRTDTEIDHIKTRYGFKSVQRTVESIRLHDKTAVKWFESHGFIQDHKKDIPNQLFLMPVDFRNAYLCGLFSADGNNAKGRSPELSCTSDQIRSQVRHLLLASGIRTSSSEGTFTKNPYSKKRINGGHKFSIKDRDSFFRDIGFLQDHKQPVKLKKASESNKYDYVPRSTVVNYLKRVREVNKESSYKLLTKQQRVNLNSILCGLDGCSKGRLIKYLYLVGLDVPAWLEDYHTAKVVDVVNTGIYVPMYDVSVNHSDHMFVGNNVLISNSWKTPILQSEQGVDWIDLHPSNREMEYNAWIEYLIKLSCAIFLIDPAELNFDLHGGVQQTPLFESSQEWKLKASRDRGLKPLLRFIAKLINENIISKIDDHFMFDFVGLDELTEQEKHTLRTEQVASYMTLNEIRRADDRHDLEYGDIPMNPTYIQAMQIKQQMEQQQQQQEQQQQMAAQQAQAPGTSPDEGTGMGPVGGPEEGEGDESPQYTDRFGKSLEARSGEKFLEIDLDLDSWKDDIRRD